MLPQRPPKNRSVFDLLAFLLFLGLLAGCAGQNTVSGTTAEATALDTIAPTPTPTGRGAGGKLRILHWQAPNILNPHLTAANKELEISRIVYEPLASFDSDNNMVLFLAAEEPTLANDGVAADGRSVTWRLKEDIQWSDGAPFTAEDVLFTYEFITNPQVNSPSSVLYEAIENIEVIDDYTVRINFTAVNPAWAIPFVGLQGVILPRHIFEAYNGPNSRTAPANTMPVGTGPYKVVEPGIEPQEVLFLGTDLIQTVKVEFVPNEYYRDIDKPFFSEIELKGGGTVNEAARAVLAAGEVDYAYNLQTDPNILDELAQDGVGSVVANFGLRIEQILINQTDPDTEASNGEFSSLEIPHPIFSDREVRQALGFAINREDIAALYGPTGQVTFNNLVAPANYVSPNQFFEYDPAQARALLDEAGWVDEDDDGVREKDGEELRLAYHAVVSQIQDQTQRIIRRDLEAVGIDVQVNLLDASVFFGNPLDTPNSLFRFPADLQAFDISSESPDPGAYMQFWTCAQIPQRSNDWGGVNVGRWCNKDYDELFAEASTEIDPDIRQELFIRMNDLQVKDVAMIPLVHLARVSGVNNSIEGLSPTPWDADLWNIKDWKRRLP